MSIDRGEQPGDFYLATLAKNMQGPGTVFAAAPGEKDLSFHSGLNPLMGLCSEGEMPVAPDAFVRGARFPSRNGRMRPSLRAYVLTREPVLLRKSSANWWQLLVCR